MVRIGPAHSVEDVREVDTLFREYAASLGFDLCFQGFERELAELPGRYAPPDGRLLLAGAANQTAGCVALRKLDPDTSEMKRLYVRPAYRGMGLGRLLAEAIIVEARRIGYTRMRLDTVGTMKAAIALYRSLGFYDIGPYYANPIAGAAYMERRLD